MTGDWTNRYWSWLNVSALPLWAGAGVDRIQCGFEELLDCHGNPVRVARRARVQGRQSFVFAYAGTLGWDGPWRDIAPLGLDFLERRYRRQDGLYATLAGPDGTIVDPAAMTYDQTFAMLAAAALNQHGLGLGEGYALDLLDRVERLRRHPAGGFTEHGSRFLSNPHMHLFEAALAWVEAGGCERWHGLARDMVDLALASFIDREHGVLLENFAADWSAAAGDAGNSVEPGHLFEWSWLLERWARLSGDGAAHDAAILLFESGSRGVDPARNVAPDETDKALRPRRATARLWPQAERLKAALLLRRADEARAAAQGLWQYLDTPKPGLWRDKMREDGGFVEEPSPASTLYHVICAVAALKEYGTLT